MQYKNLLKLSTEEITERGKKTIKMSERKKNENNLCQHKI